MERKPDMLVVVLSLLIVFFSFYILNYTGSLSNDTSDLSSYAMIGMNKGNSESDDVEIDYQTPSSSPNDSVVANTLAATSLSTTPMLISPPPFAKSLGVSTSYLHPTLQYPVTIPSTSTMMYNQSVVVNTPVQNIPSNRALPTSMNAMVPPSVPVLTMNASTAETSTSVSTPSTTNVIVNAEPRPTTSTSNDTLSAPPSMPTLK